MISIIICSRTPSISSDLIDNINKTMFDEIVEAHKENLQGYEWK